MMAFWWHIFNIFLLLIFFLFRLYRFLLLLLLFFRLWFAFWLLFDLFFDFSWMQLIIGQNYKYFIDFRTNHIFKIDLIHNLKISFWSFNILQLKIIIFNLTLFFDFVSKYIDRINSFLQYYPVITFIVYFPFRHWTKKVLL